MSSYKGNEYLQVHNTQYNAMKIQTEFGQNRSEQNYAGVISDFLSPCKWNNCICSENLCEEIMW